MPASPLTRAGALAAFAHSRLLFTAFVLAVVVMAVERCCHHDLPAIPVLVGVLSNHHVWRRYEQWLLESRHSRNTIDHYSTVLHGFWGYLERRRPPRAWHQARPKDLQGWLNQPCRAGGPNAGHPRSRNTCASYSRHAKNFYAWASKRRLLPGRDPFAEFTPVRWAARRPRALELSVLGKLMVEIADDQRLWLMAMLAYYQLLRIGEIARLSVEDLLLDNATPMVRVQGKGDREVWMPLNPALVGPLRAFLLTRPPTGPLIPNYRCPSEHLGPTYAAHLLARAMRPITGDSAHALRHTGAQQLRLLTKDPFLLQEALRHASLTTVEAYVKREPQLVAEALARMPRPPGTTPGGLLEPG